MIVRLRCFLLVLPPLMAGSLAAVAVADFDDVAARALALVRVTAHVHARARQIIAAVDALLGQARPASAGALFARLTVAAFGLVG